MGLVRVRRSDVAAAAPAAAPAKAKKPAKPRAKPTHPKITVMIVAAVKALKDRKGSSLAAIKKHIAANNKVDVAKLAPFIKKGIKSLVEKKTLAQVKGMGASGKFKLGKEEKPKKVKKAPKKKPAKKAKKPAAKKAKSPKKAAKKTPKKAAKPAKKAAPKKKASPKNAAKAKK